MGWLDVLNLGVDIYQTVQLISIKNQVSALQSGALAESLSRELITALKNAVFSVNKDLKVIQTEVNHFPKETYVVAKILEWRIAFFGITPNVFPELSDKDYAENVIQGIREVKLLSSQQLDSETIRRADAVSERIIELPQLDEWIALTQKKTQSSNLTHQIEEAKSRKSILKLLSIVSFAASIILAIVGTKSGSGAVFFLIFLLLFVGLILDAIQKRNKKLEISELTQKQKRLISTLPSQERINGLERTFGGYSIEKTQKRKEESILLIRNFMGEFKGLEFTKLK